MLLIKVIFFHHCIAAVGLDMRASKSSCQYVEQHTQVPYA